MIQENSVTLELKMRSKQPSIKINFIMNTILTLSSIIFPLITFPYVSRILQPEGLGKVNLAISLVTYFSYFAQLGLPTYGVKICAGYRDDKEKLSRTVQELTIISAVATAIAYAVFFIMVLFVPKLSSEKSLYLIISSIMILNLLGVEWLYKALEKYTYITIRSLAFKVISIIAMFLLVRSKSDYVVYGAISVFASSASNICNFIELRKYVSLKPQMQYDFRQHLKPLFILFAMTCASTIYTNLDTVMLGFMTTNTDVGYYDAAVKVKSVLAALVTSLSTVLLPRVSYYVEKKNYKEFNKVSTKALNFIFVIAVPLIVYFVFFAKECIYLLSGKAFEPSILPMQIIMPTLLFIGLTNILGIQIMIPLGKEKYVLYSTISGALTDLVLNAVFIPQMKSVGAAIGTLAAELVVLIVQFALISTDIKKIFCKIQYHKIILAVVIAALCSIWTRHFISSTFMILLISACVFFILYLSILYILKEKFVHEMADSLLQKNRK